MSSSSAPGCSGRAGPGVSRVSLGWQGGHGAQPAVPTLRLPGGFQSPWSLVGATRPGLGHGTWCALGWGWCRGGGCRVQWQDWGRWHWQI